MRKISVFNSVSLDGLFTDTNSAMDFAHNAHPDPEWDAFVSGNASGGGILLFGRITYEMMASYWPTPLAAQQMPVVAAGMNHMPKIVFSRTMEKALWNNTRLVKDDIIHEMQRMKNEPGEDMTILGSGSIVSQFTSHGLIDEFQIVVVPIVLGKGRSLFEDVIEPVHLILMDSQTFSNGNVVLTYKPGTS
jgi:dihydrofolate reductase